MALRSRFLVLLLVTFSATAALACSADQGETLGETQDRLDNAASLAGLAEGSDDAQGVLAVVNDRALGADDYVLGARIARVSADALIRTRDGINGVMESVRLPNGQWQLGGDDEAFERLTEIDALPGTDEAAFRRLRSFALENGYASPGFLITGGMTNNCLVTREGAIRCTGSNSEGQSTPPPGAFAYAPVALGAAHACALRPDKTIACWGSNSYGELNAPPGTFQRLSSSTDVETCGVGTDGSIACWGSDSLRDATPAGTFRDVRVGYGFACGQRTDDSVDCWGYAWSDTPTSPGEPLASITVGGFGHACGLRGDRTVRCWGHNDVYGDEPTSPPAGRFLAISAGEGHVCGIREEDRTVACWGGNGFGQLGSPPGRFRQIAAGRHHTCAVREDNAILCWGNGPTLEAPAH